MIISSNKLFRRTTTYIVVYYDGTFLLTYSVVLTDLNLTMYVLILYYVY